MKPKLIIVLGSQGSGKSSIATELREKLPNTTRISLSSIENDNSVNTFLYHANILNMIYDMKDLGASFIFDRFFICNEVYTRLGLKEYRDWSNEYNYLLSKLKLVSLYYDVHIFILATTKEDYERRLSKRNKFEFVKMSSENSMKQQR